MDLNLPSNLKLSRSNTYEQVVEVLRRLILEQALVPGAQLREAPLASSLGVSRNTLREAIRALTAEGLCSHDRHHSAVVAVLTEEDVHDLYGSRQVLELSGVEHVDRSTPPQIETVGTMHDRLAKLSRVGEWAEVIEADLDFHQSLVGLHGSPRLNRAFKAIRGEAAYCMSLVRLYQHEDEHPDKIIEEHGEIRQAVEARDAPTARRLLAEHLRIYEEQTRSILADRTESRTDAASSA